MGRCTRMLLKEGSRVGLERNHHPSRRDLYCRINPRRLEEGLASQSMVLRIALARAEGKKGCWWSMPLALPNPKYVPSALRPPTSSPAQASKTGPEYSSRYSRVRDEVNKQEIRD